MTLKAENVNSSMHAKDPHADILRFSLATNIFTSPEVVRNGALMLNMLHRMIARTEAFWAAKKVHRKLSFRLHNGSNISSDVLSVGNIFDAISIGRCISINRFSAEQLAAKFRPTNGCPVNIQLGDEASLVMVAVAYPVGGPLRVINKGVHISLSAHTSAGPSSLLMTKRDGIMAATAVMTSRHITSVSEEEARQAMKGMTAWVKQQPAAQFLVYQAEHAIQEGHEAMQDLDSSSTLEKLAGDIAAGMQTDVPAAAGTAATVDPVASLLLPFGGANARNTGAIPASNKRQRGPVSPGTANKFMVPLAHLVT